MSTATLELADPTPITPPPRVNRKSHRALVHLFELSGRVIEWMQVRKDRVIEAYITAGTAGWNLYVRSRSVEHDFKLSRELSALTIALFDDLGEDVDPRLIPLGTLDDLKTMYDLSYALRLSPG